MILAVYRHIQDSQRAFVKEEDVQGWLNEALYDINARLRWNRVGVTAATDGTNLIAMPAGLVEILSLRLGTNDVVFVSHDDWDSLSDAGASPGSTAGRVFGANVELYPTPAINTAYVMRYIAEPTAMSAHSDTPDLPRHLHPKLVAYAAAEALYQDGNFQLGDRKRVDYVEGLPDLPTGVTKFDPGSLTITFDPGPFDTDPMARHL